MSNWIDIKKQVPVKEDGTIVFRTEKTDCIASWFFNGFIPFDPSVKAEDITHWCRHLEVVDEVMG